MGIIAKVMTYTDDSLVQYAESVFTAVAAPISNLLRVAGVASLLFVVLNNIFQFTTVSIATYVHWVVRFALVFSFATIWANFQLLYDLMINIPEEYIAMLLKAATVNMNVTPNPDMYDPGRVTDIYTALDEFGHGIFYVAGKISAKFSFWKGSTWKYVFLGATVAVMGAIFIAAAVIIVMVAKVGFAVAIGLAPLAIAFLLFPQTRGYFSSWLNFAVGFSVVPLLTAGVMSVVLTVALVNTPANGQNDMFAGFLPFVLVSLAGLVLMFQIPTMASSLAQTSVAAVGAGALFAAKSMAGRMATSAVSKAAAPVSAARNFNYIKQNAMAGGQSRLAATGTALSAIRVGSQVRQARLANNVPFNKPGGTGGAPKALPAPPKPAATSASAGSGSRPMSEEMRNQMKK